MTYCATAGRADRAVLARNVARHAAYCRAFQTSFGIDGTRGEKHRGSSDECDEFSIHERQILVVVNAHGFVPALTKAWQVAYLSFGLRFFTSACGGIRL